MPVLRLVLPALLATASLWAHAAEPCLGDPSAKTVYSVLPVPRGEATAMHKSWAPFLTRLGQETRICFQLLIARSSPDFENDLLRGKPDFAFFNPYHQVRVRHRPGYLPLVRDSQSDLIGALVVRKDSPIRNIRELDGSRIAFPSANSYVASLLMRAHLGREGVRFSPAYLGSHGNVYRAVALGEYPAGGGANTTLVNEPAALRQQLRILHTTPACPPHPFSAHPRVPAATRAAITAAFVGMADDEPGRKLLAAIQIPRPIPADYARDYQPLEKLDLEKYVESRP